MNAAYPREEDIEALPGHHPEIGCCRRQRWLKKAAFRHIIKSDDGDFLGDFDSRFVQRQERPHCDQIIRGKNSGEF